MLVDGGVKNSVPTKIARRLSAGLIIACDVGFCVKQGKIENILQMLLQSFQIMGEELNQYQSSMADIVIRPLLGDIDQAGFHRSQEAVRLGELAAESKIQEIKERLGMRDGK
jgi:NTE family protein